MLYLPMFSFSRPHSHSPSLFLPLPLWILQSRKNVWKDVWSNANIPNVYLWCELDVQYSSVIGAQGSVLVFCRRRHQTGAEGRRGSMSESEYVFYIFQYLSCRKMGDKTAYGTCNEIELREKRIIFRLEKRLLNRCTGAFFSVIFIIDWPVFYACDACESIIWLSFILASCSNVDCVHFLRFSRFYFHDEKLQF